MVDENTLRAYESASADFAAEWEDEQDVPTDLHQLVSKYFVPGSVFDIGCGSGRETAWLASQGYDVAGFDASAGLLEQARQRHPEVHFAQAELPELKVLGTEQASNVLCETVIMHLPVADIPRSASRLYGLVSPGGTLYLSWRVTSEHDQRDASGRLYSAFSADIVRVALNGATVLHDAEVRSDSSKKVIHRLVVSKPVSGA